MTLPNNSPDTVVASPHDPREFHAPIWQGPIEDVTTFSRIDPPAVQGKPNLSAVQGKREPFSIEDTLTIVGTNTPAERETRTGRGLACHCFNGSYWSVTLRGDNKGGKAPQYDPCFQKTLETGSSSSHQCMFKPDETRDPFLFSIEDICLALQEQLLPPGRLPAGAIVITGSTSSGKSKIARGLIYLYLKGRLNAVKEKTNSDSLNHCKERRPHLVTVENPIEKYLFEDASGNSISPEKVQETYAIDYTPRQIGRDTPDLRRALLKDALRQTPAIAYVGEVRNDAELRIVTEFGGTGHLVITTAHANSVVETMERILTAAKAETAANRGQVAQRIHAIVHLTFLSCKLPESESEKSGIVPAVWRGTPSGVASLVADGPASILPNKAVNSTEVSGIGRTWFLHRLMCLQGIDPNLKNNFSLMAAVDSDLRGI